VKTPEGSRRFWIGVASRDHALKGVVGGFAQLCHGKATPLLRMVPGDGLVYYSPRERFGESAPCQRFVAIGRITGSAVYPFDMGRGFVPFRRDAAYVRGAVEAPVRPLLPLLTFVRDPAHWGAVFRFGFLEITSSDFSRIARAMEVYDERV
jgi:hypothetical protein